MSANRLEVVSFEVVSDLPAKHASLRVGGAEVDTGPYSSIDNFIERVREPLKAPRGTGFVAEHADGDPVGAEEVSQRVHERTSVARVTRGMVWEGRRDKRRRIADRCGWIEQG